VSVFGHRSGPGCIVGDATPQDAFAVAPILNRNVHGKLIILALFFDIIDHHPNTTMRLYNSTSCTPVVTMGAVLATSSSPRNFVSPMESARRKPKPRHDQDSRDAGEKQHSSIKKHQQPTKYSASSSSPPSPFCPWVSHNDTASTTSGSSESFDYHVSPRISTDEFRFDIGVVERQTESTTAKRNDQRNRHYSNDDDDYGFPYEEEENFSRTTSSTLSTRFSVNSKDDDVLLRRMHQRGRRPSGDSVDWKEDTLVDPLDLPAPCRVDCRQISREEEADPFWDVVDGDEPPKRSKSSRNNRNNNSGSEKNRHRGPTASSSPEEEQRRDRLALFPTTSRSAATTTKGKTDCSNGQQQHYRDAINWTTEKAVVNKNNREEADLSSSWEVFGNGCGDGGRATSRSSQRPRQNWPGKNSLAPTLPTSTQRRRFESGYGNGAAAAVLWPEPSFHRFKQERRVAADGNNKSSARYNNNNNNNSNAPSLLSAAAAAPPLPSPPVRTQAPKPVPQFLSAVLEERYQRAKQQQQRRTTGRRQQRHHLHQQQQQQFSLSPRSRGGEGTDDGFLIGDGLGGPIIDRQGFPWGVDQTEAVILMVRSGEDDFCRPVATYVRRRDESENGRLLVSSPSPSSCSWIEYYCDDDDDGDDDSAAAFDAAAAVL